MPAVLDESYENGYKQLGYVEGSSDLHPIYWRDYPGEWLRFHADNPNVYEWLKQSAIQLKANGHKKWGMKSLIEVMRWQVAMQTTDPVFKINNNHAPYYARYLMDMEPSLRGFFNIRETKR